MLFAITALVSPDFKVYKINKDVCRNEAANNVIPIRASSERRLNKFPQQGMT